MDDQTKQTYYDILVEIDPPLKACPFCGQGAVIVDVNLGDEKAKIYRAQCVECGAEGSSRAMGEHKNIVANAWNQRAGEEKLLVDLGQVRDESYRQWRLVKKLRKQLKTIKAMFRPLFDWDGEG